MDDKGNGIVKYVEALRAVVAARAQSIEQGYSESTLDQILRSELGRSISRGSVRLGKTGAAGEKAG